MHFASENQNLAFISTFQLSFNSFLILSCSISITYIISVVHGIPSGVHVDGYQESDEPIYPFQQYIQVRKTYTVEHVPVYEEGSPSNNLHTSASSSNSENSQDHHESSPTSHSDGSGHGGGDHYHVPRLREEVQDYKKHEVYEEKGYGDSEYDHKAYGGKGHYKKRRPSEDHYDHDEAGSSDVNSMRNSNKLTPLNRYPRQPLGPPVSSLHSNDGTSTKILEWASSNMYDKDAHEKGIYTARDNIYCPEVIDFDLSSKSMKMGEGGRGAKPRLRGLGAKITCLKNKYFGEEPLPRAIFAEPSESQKSVIQIPTFENFFKMIRHNVNSMSSFHHA